MSVPGQGDRFVHDRLPSPEAMPELVLPEHLSGRFVLNCVDRLLKDQIEAGHGERPAVSSDSVSWSYRELSERASRIAGLLRSEYGINSGERVLLRGANSPELVAFWLGVQLCGAIPVTTLSMLREKELVTILRMSLPRLCVCDHDLQDALVEAIRSLDEPCDLLGFGGASAHELDAQIARQPERFDAYPTLSDDVALIGFTSGTTGRPKATVHCHRDVVAVCEIIAEGVLGARPGDTFIGTAPLAFTFGLGGFLMFPLFVGAHSILNPRYSPESLVAAIGKHQATICFTVPTFYQRMARFASGSTLSTLRLAVCSGEALPARVREAWLGATGIALTEFLGATEMLHAFIGSRPENHRPGTIGRCFEGYEARILDPNGKVVDLGVSGRLAVRGPTGCRYLDDPRQPEYVQNGWNITGDTCSMDADGYITFHARSDDMIISSGYNISGIEVEDALLTHPAVAECAVIGEPDPARGTVVAGYVVCRSKAEQGSGLVGELQRHVQQVLAPYKYPRLIRFVDALPRSESGKIQRFRLRPD